MQIKRDFIGMFDVLKGILMLLIILVHSVEFAGDTMMADPAVGLLLQFFRYSAVMMGLFFVISGYSFQPAENLWLYIKKQFKMFLLPYGIIIVASAFLRCVPALAAGEFRIQDISVVLVGGLYGAIVPIELFGVWGSGVVALWFLPAFFFSNVIYQLIWRIKNKKLAIALIWILSVGAVCFSSVYQVQLPWCLVQSCAALGFLETGRLLKKYKLLYQKINHFYILGALAVWILSHVFLTANMAANEWSYGPLSYAAAFPVCVILLNLYMRTGFAAARFTGLLSYLGRYSLWILFLHGAELLIVPWDRRLGMGFSVLGLSPIVTVGCAFVLRVVVICLVIWAWNAVMRYAARRRIGSAISG